MSVAKRYLYNNDHHTQRHELESNSKACTRKYRLPFINLFRNTLQSESGWNYRHLVNGAAWEEETRCTRDTTSRLTSSRWPRTVILLRGE